MRLRDLPELSFAERSPEIIESNIVKTAEGLLNRKLARADPLRLFLCGVEAIIVQQRELIDQTAKMNLLAYATGDNLDHIGALVGTERIGAAPARTTLQLALSAARETATSVPRGLRVTAGDVSLMRLLIRSRSLRVQQIPRRPRAAPIGRTTSTIASGSMRHLSSFRRPGLQARIGILPKRRAH